MSTKYTKEKLTEVIATASSMRQVLLLLGLKYTGGNYSNISKHIKQHNIDTSHFTGQGHLKGKQHDWNRKVSNQDMFTQDSSVGRTHVKRRILRDSLIEYKCFSCSNLGKYNGMPLVLELDHINGIFNDNRLENLRFLCPNCHSQMDTSSGKHNKK